MTPRCAKAFAAELAAAHERIAQGEDEAARRHLQRAHVLGQRFVVPHVRVHALMLRLDLRGGRLVDAAGQLARMVLGAVGSLVGRVPLGNTGGSDVSMFAPMPIPAELHELLGDGHEE